MSDDRFSFPGCVIAGKRRLDVDDLLMLRKHAFSDGIRTEDDARLLLAIHRACASSCPQWDCYVIESIAAFAVHRREPRGWMDEAKAGWLIDTLSVNAVVLTPLELEIILHALDLATSAPDRLYAFALEQMRLGLLPNSRTAYALGRTSSGHGIELVDIHYLWRVIRSACDGGRMVLSSAEQKVLQAIDALAAPTQHHPGWNSLMITLQLREASTCPNGHDRWLKAPDASLLETTSYAA